MIVSIDNFGEGPCLVVEGFRYHAPGIALEKGKIKQHPSPDRQHRVEHVEHVSHLQLPWT